MYILAPIYEEIAVRFATRINHFPLIRLIFLSLDKTLVYFIMFETLFWLFRGLHLIKPIKTHWLDHIAFGYTILLYCSTVFRESYLPWHYTWYWNRPISQINLMPLVKTLQLLQGASSVDFYYNLLGNICWFIPLGLYFQWRFSTAHKWRLLKWGALTSLSIEILQFFLWTGVADIDDLIFNTCGTGIGILMMKWVQTSIKSRK